LVSSIKTAADIEAQNQGKNQEAKQADGGRAGYWWKMQLLVTPGGMTKA